jgi:colicin import membrane protein
VSNEGKTTKAYKISPELKEKLERLAAESGLDTQEAFIEQLAALYELQRLKEGNGSGYAKQIDELEYHTRRSVELFVGMINTEAAARLQQSQQHDETLADRAATIFAQEQEIAEQRKAAKAQAEELARIAKESEQQAKLVEQLEASARDKGLIVDQYKEKVDTLSGLVSQYTAAAEENKDLKTEVSRLTTLTDKQGERVAALEGDLAALDELRGEQLRQAEAKQAEALERLSERKDTEKEREALAIRTEYQSKLEAAQTEATAKIRELYDQIERQRAAHEQQIREIQQPKDDGKTPPAKK